MPLLLPPHGFLAFLALLSSTLPVAVIVYTVHPLLSQWYWKNLIYCPIFLGTIHCTDYWRPAKSLLFSTVFCQLLWCFYYPSLFQSLPTIFGHMAPLSTHIASSVSSPAFVHIYCIWVSLWTHLVLTGHIRPLVSSTVVSSPLCDLSFSFFI